MLCPLCNQRFDQAEREERRLPECGHSLCAKCSALEKDQSSITCPTCGKKQHPLPPKSSRSKTSKVVQQGNQALLEVEKTSSSDEDESESESDMQSMTSINKTEHLCPIHFKNFDGFCLSCNTLICIDCIFEKHKTHDFYQLDKARTKACQDLQKMKMRVESLRDDCHNRLKQAQSAQTDLKKGFEQRLLEIKTVMNELRRFILSRETKLEEALKRDFDQCIDNNHSNIQILEKELLKYDSTLASINYNRSQEDIRMLGSFS